MALIPISLELEYYNDPASYKPLASGQLYIGQPDTDPEILANRITVTLRQEDGTEVPIAPAQQPLTISDGGRITYNGSVAQILADQSYSLKVLNNLGNQRYYIAKAGQLLDTPVPPAADEWSEGGTPTYITPNSFSISGNQTATYHKGRRVRSTNTNGITYSTIDSASFDGTKTTVILENTSGVLDIGLSAVAYGINSSIDSSIPGDLPNLRELTISKQVTTPKAITSINMIDPPVTAGTGAAYTAVLNETAYQTNRIYQIRIHVDNTGPCTLDIDGNGPLDIKTLYGSDPQAGELKADMVADLRNNGTHFVLLNSALKTTEQIADRAIENSKIRSAVSGTILSASSDVEDSSVSASPEKSKEIYVPYGGVFNVSFELRTAAVSTIALGRIYLNGFGTGTLRSTTSTTYVTFTEDIAVNPGSLLQLYFYRSGTTSSAFCRNFRIREAGPLAFIVIS